MLRIFAARASVVTRAAVRPAAAAPVVQARGMAEELTPQAFDAKWVAYFEDETLSSREIRRGLNDVFANDLVPDPTILSAALRATRRVNDFPTSVRIFEGVKDKAPDAATYDYVVQQLKPVIDELQLSTPEELGF
mmetsp:Transcript_29152/g.76327  ORF Transcript_29152/g.76327 Transcript_29152/m.76327 type:complete len:135 (-) Transcript_29152:179-583(-)